MSDADIRVVAEIDSSPATAGAQQFATALNTMRAGVEGAAASIAHLEASQAAAGVASGEAAAKMARFSGLFQPVAANSGAAAAGVAGFTASISSASAGTTAAQASVATASNGMRMFSQAAQTVATGAAQAAASIGQLGQGAAEAMGSIASASGALKLFMAYLTFEAVKNATEAVVHMSDAFAMQVGRLKVVTGSTEEALSVYHQLSAAADRARVPIDMLADAYYKNSRALNEMGVSNRDAVALNETLAKVITLSGTTTQAAAAGMYELNQAFMVGRLNGREFRSIAQDLPLVLRILEQQTGKTAGELRHMASTGEITAQTLYAALHNATDSVNKDFTTLPQTAGNALTILEADFGRTMGVIANDAGVTREFTRVFNELTASLNDPNVQAGMKDIALAALEIARGFGLATAGVASFAHNFAEFAAAHNRELRTLDAIQEKDGYAARLLALANGSAGDKSVQDQYLMSAHGPSRPGVSASAGTAAQGSWASTPDAEFASVPVTFGKPSDEQAQKHAKKLVETTREHLAQLKLANDLSQARLSGDTLEATALENQLTVARGITPELRKMNPALATQLEHQLLIEASLKRQQEEQNQLRQVGEEVGNTIADTFMDAAKQGLSFEDALRQVVAKLIEMGAQLLVIKPLVEALGDSFAGTPGASQSKGGIGSFLSTAVSGLLGGMPHFADGGTVGTGTVALIGEAGPEAVMPLTRGANGQLGVRAVGEGGGQSDGGGSPVSVVINIAGDATDATAAKMQGIARQVAEAVVATRAKGIIGASVQATRNEIVRNPSYLRRA